MTEEKRGSLARVIEVVRGSLYVRLQDGRLVPIPLTSRLRAASPQERADATITGHGTQIRWPALDEDLSVAHLVGVSEEDLYRLARINMIPPQLVLFDAPTAAAPSVTRVRSATSVGGWIRTNLAPIGGLNRQTIEKRNGETAARPRAASLPTNIDVEQPTAVTRKGTAVLGT